MRSRYIVESENAPSQLEEEVGTEGDESPEWKDWYDFVLDGLGAGYDVEEAGEVERRGQQCQRDGLLCPRHD